MDTIESFWKSGEGVDYMGYVRYCLKNNLTVAAYTDFAEYRPSNLGAQRQIVVPNVSKCGTCGGGKVR